MIDAIDFSTEQTEMESALTYALSEPMNIVGVNIVVDQDGKKQLLVTLDHPPEETPEENTYIAATGDECDLTAKIICAMIKNKVLESAGFVQRFVGF